MVSLYYIKLNYYFIIIVYNNNKMSTEDNTFSEFIHSYPITSLKHVKYAVCIVLFAIAWRMFMHIDEAFATY
jgi:hypothetical protein